MMTINLIEQKKLSPSGTSSKRRIETTGEGREGDVIIIHRIFELLLPGWGARQYTREGFEIIMKGVIPSSFSKCESLIPLSRRDKKMKKIKKGNRIKHKSLIPKSSLISIYTDQLGDSHNPIPAEWVVKTTHQFRWDGIEKFLEERNFSLYDVNKLRRKNKKI